jgi:rhodanese-related sulfurtransferase
MKVLKGDLWVQTSFDGGDSFEPAVRVNDVQGEVSSHGESSPQMQIRTRSEFYTLWQTRRGEGSVLRFARSMNWGESFSKAVEVDPTSTSQAFFTMNVSPKGVIYAAWLDGRDRGKGRMGTSAVYLTRSTDKGQTFEKPVRVALDVCPCCRPSIGFGGDGSVYVSWRGVLENNVRDIFVAASPDGGATWGAAVRVAEDNWVLNGCPHSGAALASIGKRLFIAWHAVRDKQVTLSLAYSDDGGKTFSRRAMLADDVLDANHPYMSAVGGRLGIVFQGRPPARQQGWAPISVYYREVDAEARLSPLQTVGQASGSASYPVFTFEEPERVFITWTEPDKENKVVVLARGRRSNAAAAGGGNGGK